MAVDAFEEGGELGWRGREYLVESSLLVSRVGPRQTFCSGCSGSPPAVSPAVAPAEARHSTPLRSGSARPTKTIAVITD